MAQRFVLDTNVFRYANSHPGFGADVMARFHPLSHSAVVLSELRRAARAQAPSRQIKELIRNAQNDALIALSTWRKGFTLVTCDQDFAPILSHGGYAADRLVTLRAP